MLSHYVSTMLNTWCKPQKPSKATIRFSCKQNEKKKPNLNFRPINTKTEKTPSAVS